MFHSLFASWMQLTRDWGYGGVFLMMAIESTVFPLPSEIVVPPAAYWARQGHFSFWGIVLASTLGSWAGSAVSYWVARRLGRPLILRYGRYVFVPESKWLMAEQWIRRYSAAGVFFARLLPVVRHLVSLPAGAARLPFATFSIMTLLGSAVWSTVLAWFGAQVLGDQPRLLEDPDALVHVLKDKLLWFVAAAAVLFGLYVAVDLIGRKLKREAAGEAELP
ncbi:MAG: DedA family protein [Candidatus Eisenbacteria bacterium]|uniref:DedA family protein n=1 Tax=Eiseniibacteriota bacterium TaxID=2212470 RepID=A0A849SJ18_UNCEI|nr:DedA family protein [Candidatus Eisenbacteria bacterium]